MNSQAAPGHLSVWTKIQLGWLEPINITKNGVYEVSPIEFEPVAYRIDPGCFPGEYFLIENRHAFTGDFDEFFWQPGGILIYHIDENNLYVDGFGNSPRGGPFQKNWPANGNHYPVALLQRDGKYELEQALNDGHSEDFYYSSEHSIGPGNGENVARNGTYPNTDCYSLGTIVPTGLSISNFQQLRNNVMRFQVLGLAESSQPTAFPSSAPTAAATGTATTSPGTPLPSILATNYSTLVPTSTPVSLSIPAVFDGRLHMI